MRTGYKTRPYEKSMEVFQNFSGGLNTVSPPDGMLDNELIDMLNEDISERGSLKRRFGLRKLQDLPAGKKQGYFRYYNFDGTYEELYAIDGYIYRGSDMRQLNTANPFQTSKMIEAVQFGETLYIATGTKLMVYEGDYVRPVDPYQPTTMEMTYIGSNALADDPTGFLQDTIGLVPSIDYMVPYVGRDTSRMWINAKVYCTKIDGESYEYSIQVRNSSHKGEAWTDPGTDTWCSLGTDHEIGGDYNKWLTAVYYNTRVSSTGDYEVRVLMRKVGTTDVLSESVGSITVQYLTSTVEKDTSTIHQCTRILLHWGRLMLYGDPYNPATLYMSHLNTPNYFPSLLNIDFDSPRRESLTNIVHYRNSLVVFTKTSTQALYGTGPDDYRRTMLHTDLGCISPYGAAVMKNGIGFLSVQGVYSLKTMALTDDKATVEKLDTKIDNIVPRDTDAIALFNDGQLQITFPSRKTRIRYYYDLGSWTKDYSDKFDFANAYNIDGEIFALGSSAMYQFDKTVFDDDDYNYENLWESKYLNFGQPYHPKKLRELQILTAPNNESMTCTVYVYADEQAVITPDSSHASIVDGAVVWVPVIQPNFHVSPSAIYDDNVILGDSVFGDHKYSKETLKLAGKCLRTRIRVSNQEAKENHFIGFAYIFKVKKP